MARHIIALLNGWDTLLRWTSKVSRAGSLKILHTRPPITKWAAFEPRIPFGRRSQPIHPFWTISSSSISRGSTQSIRYSVKDALPIAMACTRRHTARLYLSTQFVRWHAACTRQSMEKKGYMSDWVRGSVTQPGKLWSRTTAG